MSLSFTASPDTDSSGKGYDAIVLLSAGAMSSSSIVTPYATNSTPP